METITISVNKMAIGIALIVGLVIGGLVGGIAGSHHARSVSRGQFQGNYGPMMRGAHPMMDQDTMNKMMEKKATINANIAPVPEATPSK